MEINPFWLYFCIIIPLAGIIIFAWGLWSERRQSAKKIAGAKDAYEDALSALKNDPQSEDAFQEALQKGREYVDLEMFDRRDSFDEKALLDQLNGARPGVERLTSLDDASIKAAVHPKAQQLAELEEMRQGGTLTAAEYHERLNQILNQ